MLRQCAYKTPSCKSGPVFQISISQNTKCADKIGFPKTWSLMWHAIDLKDLPN